MRAISSFNFEAGISTRECLAATALRIRVNMSAIGSVMLYSVKRFQIFNCRFAIEKHPNASNRKSKIQTRKFPLPTGFHDAGNLPSQCQLAEANPAQVKFSQVSARASAPATARVAARRKLWFAIRLSD